jgi:hypothetical protein
MQVLPVSQVAYILMYYQTATYNELLPSIMVLPALSYLTMHLEKFFPLHFLFYSLFAAEPTRQSQK